MLIAIDAGGTSTRAVTLDTDGRTYGYGRAGSGNPTAVGVEAAVLAIGAAAEQALGGSASGADLAVIAMAGEKSDAFRSQVTARLARLRIREVTLQHDLLAMFHSGTHEVDGYALIAGTGSVAARVRGGELERVAGGRGWLLGDAGSGFWIGHRVVRAVISALDGAEPVTALTGLVLAAAGLAVPAPGSEQTQALHQLVSYVYARPPVRLAELAPLAFRAYEDPVARDILVAASAALVDLMAVVRVPELTGPVVVGGSVLVRGMMTAPPDLRPQLAGTVIPVADGVVGAAVLALREAGVEVDAALFRTVRAEVARLAR